MLSLWALCIMIFAIGGIGIIIVLDNAWAANINCQSNQTCSGTPMDDRLNGTSGQDDISAIEGNDIIAGLAADDSIKGGDDSDTMYGGTGNDRLEGDDGDDKICGNSGDDVLIGREGNDFIYGDSANTSLASCTGAVPGADRLFGEEGDELWGGPGKDTFDCGGFSDSIIKDFELGVDDKINCSMAGVPMPEPKPGEVKTPDLANGAVTSPKIKDGEVKTPDLANGAVTSPKIKDGEVKTPDLANGAVTSPKISDGGVQTEDLANGAVTKEKLASNSVKLVIIKRESPFEALQPNQSTGMGAFCNAGEIVTGGGGGGATASGFTISHSAPDLASNGWVVNIRNPTGLSGGVQAVVLCAHLELGP
jgi:Ca2+-binding RTX toxin-like protein